MIKRTSFILADGFTPYRNQAVEEYLMMSSEPETCTLYLWQNQRTVVIGRNQNVRGECRAELLEREGGYLARRLSGGGAVFHDMGNINFSFFASDPDYSVARQQKVILGAVRSFGLDAELSGRNDITVGGQKFSGNAFISSGTKHCHHGTLLISADTSDMGRYLSVPKDKLESKGVRSVRSRVVNLAELNGAITVESITEALLQAFEEEYKSVPRKVKVSELDSALLDSLTEKFASPSWRFETEPDFMMRKSGRFSWGGAELCFKVSCGKTVNVRLFTDAMDPSLSLTAEQALTGVPFSAEALKCALLAANTTEEQRQMLEDISSLVTEA